MAEQTDGLMSIEDIIKIHHKKNYRNSYFKLNDAFRTFNLFARMEGSEIARLRNSLFLMRPKDYKGNMEIHTITADPAELFYGFVLRFIVSLYEKRGVKKIISPISKEKNAKKFKEVLSPDFVAVKKLDNGLNMIIDVEGFYKKYSKGVQK